MKLTLSQVEEYGRLKNEAFARLRVMDIDDKKVKALMMELSKWQPRTESSAKRFFKEIDLKIEKLE